MKSLEPKIGPNQFHSLQDVASMFNVCAATVRTWIREGKLECYRLGGDRAAFRISSEQLDRFVAGSESTADANTSATVGTTR